MPADAVTLIVDELYEGNPDHPDLVRRRAHEEALRELRDLVYSIANSYPRHCGGCKVHTPQISEAEVARARRALEVLDDY